MSIKNASNDAADQAPLRYPRSYMVQPRLNDAMKAYAVRHGYTLASCVDAAFSEFLSRHASEK